MFRYLGVDSANPKFAFFSPSIVNKLTFLIQTCIMVITLNETSLLQGGGGGGGAALKKDKKVLYTQTFQSIF